MMYARKNLSALDFVKIIKNFFVSIFSDGKCVHFVGSYYVCSKHNKLALICRGEGDNYYLNIDESVNFLTELAILDKKLDDFIKENIEHVFLIGFITITVKNGRSLFSNQVVYDVNFYSNERALPSSSASVSRKQLVSGIARATKFIQDALSKTEGADQ